MNVGHLRQHRLREQVFQRLAERFFFRLWVLNFRFDDLFLRHFGDFRQGNQQPLQGSWRQGQVFLLPAQARGEIHHRNGGVVDLDVDVVERHAVQRDRIRRREIERTALLFLHRRRFRHFLRVYRHVHIF
ncbi:hypothetical protein D3C86_1607760 [compost metagenome]